MAQLKQLASVANGSQTVTVANVDISFRVAANNIFMVVGELVPYTVASAKYDGTNTLVTLTGAYQGPTNLTAQTVFVTDFTYPDNIPLISQGDVGTAAIFTNAMYKLQDLIKVVDPEGLVATVAKIDSDLDASQAASSAANVSAGNAAQSAASAASNATSSDTSRAAAQAAAAAAASSQGAAASSATDAASSATTAGQLLAQMKYPVSRLGDTMSGPLMIQSPATDTTAQFDLSSGSGVSGQESKIRLFGTYPNSTDTTAKLAVSLRAGFAQAAWGSEYLDFWMNSAANDGSSDASQVKAMRLAAGGRLIIKPQLIVDDQVSNLQVGGSGRFSGGVMSFGLDAGGANLRMSTGARDAMWRNDSTNLYLLLSDSSGPSATFNGLRPFTVNTSTGVVTLDATGVGTYFGGSINVTGSIQSTGVTVSGSAQILAAKGQAAVPSISFTSEGAYDSGLFHIADGTFGVTNNGVETARFIAASASGTTNRMLIGTQVDNGSDTLQVRAQGDGQGILVTGGGNNTNVGGAISFAANVGSAPMAMIKGMLSYNGNSQDHGSLSFLTRATNGTSDAALVERMRIANSGRVVVTGEFASGATAYFGPDNAGYGWANSDANSAYFYGKQNVTLGANGASGNINFAVGNATVGTINSSGRLLLGATDDGSNRIQTAGGIRAASSTGALIAQAVSAGSQTSIMLTRISAPKDQNTWEHLHDNNGNFTLRSVNDGYTSASAAFTVSRGSGVNVGLLQLMPAVGRVTIGAITDDGQSCLQGSGNASFLGGISAAGLDAGGATIRMAAPASRDAMWRNDGTNLYLLMSDTSGVAATFNGLRPFTVSTSAGVVTIDATGVGTYFGGSINVAGEVYLPGGSGGEGRLHVGKNDGYFYGNAQGAGWWSPTIGSWQLASTGMNVNGHQVWTAGNVTPLDTIQGGSVFANVILSSATQYSPGLILNANGYAPYIRSNGVSGQLEIVNGANSAVNVSIEDAGRVNFPRARPIWLGFTPWDTGNFDGAGAMVRTSADGHKYGMAWDSSSHLNFYVDGTGVAYIASNASDARLKENIKPIEQDSLALIDQIEFKTFDFIERVGGGHVEAGLIAQQAREISDSWVTEKEDWAGLENALTLNEKELLMSAMHAIQQLSTRVRGLEAQLAERNQ
ncbi:tail fiber domain-containing protein [Burkholderia gladioli]|uniref:tail fiber domain-containing protein n=1 Tax=Burkholderia gladioli TaxID=28095 RepID=UPI003B511A3B